MTDNPFVKRITAVYPIKHEGGYKIVVLDRVEDVEVPDYCIHGKVTCHRCSRFCWLGSESYKMVITGDTIGMCLQCATEVGVGVLGKPVANVNDHRRADGPH